VLFDEETGDPPRDHDFAKHTDEVLTALGCAAEDIEQLCHGSSPERAGRGVGG